MKIVSPLILLSFLLVFLAADALAQRRFNRSSHGVVINNNRFVCTDKPSSIFIRKNRNSLACKIAAPKRINKLLNSTKKKDLAAARVLLTKSQKRCKIKVNLSSKFLKTVRNFSNKCIGVLNRSQDESKPDVEIPSSLPLAVSNIKFSTASRNFTAYVYSDGGQDFAQVNVSANDRNKISKFNVRVISPSGELAYWSQKEFIGGINTANYVSRQEPSIPDTPFHLPQQGVYEIRISTNGNAKADIFLSKTQNWGISYQNGVFLPIDGVHDSAYFFAPRHPNRKLFTTIEKKNQFEFSVFNENNVTINNNNLITNPNGSNDGEVWRIKFANNNYRFTSYGFPIVLSPSAETAKLIKAGIRRITGGRLNGYLVNHNQQELSEVMDDLLQYVGNADSLYNYPSADAPINQSACINPQNNADVIKYKYILTEYPGALPMARWALDKFSFNNKFFQSVEPNNPWSGSIGNAFFGKQVCTRSEECANGSICGSGRCSVNFNPYQDRWDIQQPLMYSRIDNANSTMSAYGGLSIRQGGAYSLIFSATENTPCNPYRPIGGNIRYPQLFVRGVVESLSRLMLMDQSELPRGLGHERDSYTGGGPTFAAPDMFEPFGLAAPQIDKVIGVRLNRPDLASKLKKQWTLNLRRYMDARYNDHLASTRNQSAHYLTAFYAFAEGVRGTVLEKTYEDLARAWAQDFFASMKGPGYPEERTGPDSSYVGMTNSFIGAYRQKTAKSPYGVDRSADVVLANIYSIFNHTTSPEPDGKNFIGGFNYNLRVGNGFEDEQWSGAKNFVDDIPEVGVWNRNLVDQMSSLRSSLVSDANRFGNITKNLHNINLGGIAGKYFGRYDLTPSSKNKKFPVEEGSFVKNFGNELIAIKTPNYFFSVFVGKPAASRYYIEHQENFRMPSAFENTNPNSAHESLPKVPIRDVAPYGGGGITNFWSKSYGTSLVSTNWAPTLRHGLIAAFTGGARYWEDYFNHSFQLNTAQKQLKITGEIENTPLRYERTYNYLDNELKVTLKITALASVSNLSSLTEVLPFATCTRSYCGVPTGNLVGNRKSNGASLVKADNSNLTDGNYSSFKIKDNSNKGVEVKFTGSVPIKVTPHGARIDDWRKIEYQVGNVQVQLPKNFSANQSYTLSYSLRPY